MKFDKAPMSKNVEDHRGAGKGQAISMISARQRVGGSRADGVTAQNQNVTNLSNTLSKASHNRVDVASANDLIRTAKKDAHNSGSINTVASYEHSD